MTPNLWNKTRRSVLVSPFCQGGHKAQRHTVSNGRYYQISLPSKEAASTFSLINNPHIVTKFDKWPLALFKILIGLSHCKAFISLLPLGADHWKRGQLLKLGKILVLMFPYQRIYNYIIFLNSVTWYYCVYTHTHTHTYTPLICTIFTEPTPMKHI